MRKVAIEIGVWYRLEIESNGNIAYPQLIMPPHIISITNVIKFFFYIFLIIYLIRKVLFNENDLYHI